MATNEQIIGLIKAGAARQRAQAVYGTNAEGERAAFILPDGSRPSDFAPDPDGVNINGSSVARLIYQARLPSDPSPFGASRVGMWMSTIWEPMTVTPEAKASRYSLYVTAKGLCEHPEFPQEVSALVAKAETAAAVTHGKTETSIMVAAHEVGYADAQAEDFGLLTEAGEVLASESGAPLLEQAAAPLPVNGKLVVQQQVLAFRGADIGWDADPDDDDETGPEEPQEQGSVPEPPRDHYFSYGTAFNNAGPVPGFAAGIVKARKAEKGGSPWHHGFFVKKDAVGAYPFRFQKYWGVQAPGFDPLDGSGPRAMSYMGVGTDLPDTPLHVKGPIPVEARLEYAGDASAPYTLGKIGFRGRTTATVAPAAMAEWQVDVTEPAHGAENAVVTLKNRYGGVLAERLKIGQGLYDPGANLGDMGNGSLNFRALYINGRLALGKDTTAPDTPTGLAAGAQVMRTSPAGTQQVVVPWSWTANTEDDLAGYVVALQRGSSGFRSVKVQDNAFECLANPGEVLQLKVLAHDKQHNVSAFSAPVSYTVTGDGSAPSPVTVATAPDPRPKGVLMKMTAPADANFGGVAVYVNTANNSAAATLLDFVPGRPGKKLKYRDDDTHAVGQTLWYWAASVNQDLVESATRTALGSVVYAGVKSADVEANQILLGTHVADSSGALVGDNDALNTKAHGARGFNRNPTFQRWPAANALPDNFAKTGGTAVTVSKATGNPRYGSWAMRIANTSGQSGGVDATDGSGELRLPNDLTHVAFEWDVDLVAGDFVRAGVYLRLYFGGGTSIYRQYQLDLNAEHPSAGPGRYADSKAVAIAATVGSPSGAPTSAQLFIRNADAIFTGAISSAKTIDWHSVVVRKATREEIKALKGLDDNGDLTRDLTLARKVSSQIMTHASGGAFTGELAATVGATLGTNLKTGAGVTVTENDALNTKLHDIRSYNRNPTFQRWSGALPDNWTAVGSPTAVKQTTAPRYGDWSLEVAYPASDNQYMLTSGAEVRTPPSPDDHYVIEYEVELVSGDFNRAGVWWRVNYQDTSNYKSFVLDLSIEHPSASTGQVYSGCKVITGAATGAPTGAPGSAGLYLMGNHLLMGDAVSAKTLRWHRVGVRKATREEIRTAKGLDDNGDLTRDLTLARKISSQIMTHAAGGAYTGDLAATVGAVLGTNLKTAAGATVSDNDALNSKAHDGRGYNRQPTFQRWSGSLPDNWSASGAPTVTKQTTAPRYGDWSLEVAYPASDNQYLFAGAAEVRSPASADDYYVIEYEVELVSGDFNRAGIWWRVDYQDSSNFKHFTLDLSVEHPGAATNKVYGGSKVMAANVNGAPTGLPSAGTLFLIGNHNLMGDTVSAKTLRWHRVSVRKASKEEVKAATLGALASKSTVGASDIDAASVGTSHVAADSITKPDFASVGLDKAMTADGSGADAQFCQFDITGSATSGTNGLILAAGQIDADNTAAGQAYVGVFVDDAGTFANVGDFKGRALFWQRVYIGQGQSAPFSISVFRALASGGGSTRKLSLRGMKISGGLSMQSVSTLTFINFKR